MAFSDTISLQRARSLAFQGALLCFVLCLLAQLNLRAFGVMLSFAFLPFIAVFLWPRLADPLTSVLCLFGLGLFLDLLGETSLGFWPLVFLSYFMVFRPDRREGQQGLLNLWLGLIIAGGVTALFMVAISLVLVAHRPNLWALGQNWAVTFVLFPLIFFFVRAIGRKGSDGSSAGFAV